MNRRRLALTVLGIATIASAGHAFATGTADPSPTTPTGVGDLMPTPDLTHGDTRNLFEAYSSMSYLLDTDEGAIPDGFKGILNAYANMLMLGVIAITRGAISVGWWLFSLTEIKAVSTATVGIITSASSALTSWLLPAALAFGAVVAFARHQGSREGGALGQVLWVVASGVLAISFTAGASMWVGSIDTVRQLGATAVMDASTRTITNNNQDPFVMPEPSYDRGSQRDKMLRQSADATWRAFAVTPWCLAEFGSLDACKRYGKGMLDQGLDGEKRKRYINEEISRAEGGDDAPTVKWTKGDNPVGRIVIAFLALAAAIIFATLTISLCFAAAMAFIGSLLMLVAGVFFACLWVIPGRPRQWGINWFETLIGLVLQSVLALLVFGTALSLVTAVYSLSGSMGWLPVNGLALAVLFAAFRMRRMLEGVTQVMRPGMGSSGLMGALALRQVVKGFGKLIRAGKGRRGPASKTPPRTKPWPDTELGKGNDGERLLPPPSRPTPPPPEPRPTRPGGPKTPGGGRGPLRQTAEADIPAAPAQADEEISVPRPRRVATDQPAKDPHEMTVTDQQKISTSSTTSTRTPGQAPAPATAAEEGDDSSSGSERLPSNTSARPVTVKTPRPSTEPNHLAPRAYRPGRATSRYETTRPSAPTLREGPPAPGAPVRKARPQTLKFRSYTDTPDQGPARSRGPERIPERTR